MNVCRLGRRPHHDQSAVDDGVPALRSREQIQKKGDETLLAYLASRLTREPGLFTLSSYVPHSSLHLIAANLPAETRGIGVSQHGGVRRGAQEGLELRRHLVRHQRLGKAAKLISLARKHTPQAKVVLGGFGTALHNVE